MQQKLVLSFLDRVAAKNKLQIDILHEAGFQAGFFVNSYYAAAEKYFIQGDTYQILKPSLLGRLFQIFSFLLKYRKQIHHLEVYPGGRFAFIYVLLAKILSLKVICVERGDLCYLISGRYDKLTRISMQLCYRWSDLIWYREVYMKDFFHKIGYEKKLFFLHNAIEIESIAESEDDVKMVRDIDFLWVNRIIPERKSDWVIDILNQSEFEKTNNVMAGLLENTLYKKEQDYVVSNKPNNLQIIDFIDNPAILYNRAKFFLLPATIVFANNALLEAMSYGCVPIVTKAPGSDLIVSDGVNGFEVDFDIIALKKTMKSVLKIEAHNYEKLSTASKNHVLSEFSSKIYRQKLIELYQLIQNRYVWNNWFY